MFTSTYNTLFPKYIDAAFQITSIDTLYKIKARRDTRWMPSYVIVHRSATRFIIPNEQICYLHPYGTSVGLPTEQEVQHHPAHVQWYRTVCHSRNEEQAPSIDIRTSYPESPNGVCHYIPHMMKCDDSFAISDSAPKLFSFKDDYGPVIYEGPSIPECMRACVDVRIGSRGYRSQRRHIYRRLSITQCWYRSPVLWTDLRKVTSLHECYERCDGLSTCKNFRYVDENAINMKV